MDLRKRPNAASSSERLLEAMMRFPILMNRPIVVTDKGVKLCRPAEKISEIIS